MKKALIVAVSSIVVLFLMAMVEEKELFFGRPKEKIPWSEKTALKEVNKFAKDVSDFYKKPAPLKDMSPAMAPILEDFEYLRYTGQRLELNFEKDKILEIKRLSDKSAKVVRLERWRRRTLNGKTASPYVQERFLAIYNLAWMDGKWKVINWQQRLTRDTIPANS